jgi:hypothetical protein
MSGDLQTAMQLLKLAQRYLDKGETARAAQALSQAEDCDRSGEAAGPRETEELAGRLYLTKSNKASQTGEKERKSRRDERATKRLILQAARDSDKARETERRPAGSLRDRGGDPKV